MGNEGMLGRDDYRERLASDVMKVVQTNAKLVAPADGAAIGSRQSTRDEGELESSLQSHSEPQADVKQTRQPESRAEPEVDLPLEPQADLPVEPQADLQAEPQAESPQCLQPETEIHSVLDGGSSRTLQRATELCDESQSRVLSQTELVLQYGHLYGDLAQIHRACVKKNRNAFELFVRSLLLVGIPVLLVEMLYTSMVTLSPATIVSMMQWLSFSSFTGAQQVFVFQCFHALLFGILTPLLLLAAAYIAFSRVYNTGLLALLSPTHVGTLASGLRFHWQYGPVSFTAPLLPWNQVMSVELIEKDKRNRSCNKLMLRYTKGRFLKLDVDCIRREPERAALGSALKSYLPDSMEHANFKDLIERSLPPERRYTEIWTQALLNRPDRLCLKALSRDACLQDGKYQVIGQIGQGGQGTAYLATASGGGREETVVLKEYVLPDHNNLHDRRRALQRLQDEVQILSRLDHPQVVNLRDVFVEDHRAYLVLDYINGASLKAIVTESGALQEKRVVDLALQMCLILEYLHGLSPPLIHQDFTPDNLLLDSASDELKLVDFNVSRESRTIKTGLVVGKQAYMPPEQFKGKSCVESDLYALGGTVYFLLTGDEPEPLTVARPKVKRPELSDELDRFVARATSLEVQGRFASAAEMRDVLLSLPCPESPASVSDEPMSDGCRSVETSADLTGKHDS